MAPRAVRSKVKSGCRTCKARKVKCDEGKPVCLRCHSTGRVCEGYGIWGGGGGGNDYGRRPVASSGRTLTSFYPSALIKAANQAETQCLEWFAYRSTLKLPGVFRFEFWDKLVFQAASTEPAVLHAILALSSAHRREGLDFNTSIDVATVEQEHFVLKHYTNAITHLQPHFASKSNWSIRVALIACLMFVITEYFRGNFLTGYNHLQNGLRILNEYRARSSAIGHYSLFQESCCDPADAWIIQAFIRLDVQAKFQCQGSQFLNITQEDCSRDSPAIPPIFQSTNEGRQLLDRIINQIFYLSHECRRQGQFVDSLSLLSRQQNLEAKLNSWYDAFKASRACLLTSEITQRTAAYILLEIYYTVAKIMIDTCLRLEDQMRYDMHTTAFEFIMNQLDYILNLSLNQSLAHVLHFSDASISIADLGAILALYYVALKCRVHSIRRRVVNYAMRISHQEGIWNSHLVARIIQEVINIEEDGFYNESEVVEADKSGRQAVLPASHRLHDIEVQPPDGREGTAILRCKRRSNDSSWEVITRELVFDMENRCWVSKPERT
ncbi:uncharacterized protein F4812DRAFT_98883 [Daldinia caldariorum]|uniref:uncharacterized protein n=1 Tax=Daldinia caldariorum TaxID=326644 RepID=UPI0020087532|nr:uncharacterized protein F4812DRAFT_98883 [Daldinia caldariorum]KAI1466159.1 hypothetical protein F4812DRAFT_98883 [Daldinia caldariorum]